MYTLQIKEKSIKLVNIHENLSMILLLIHIQWMLRQIQSTWISLCPYILFFGTFSEQRIQRR